MVIALELSLGAIVAGPFDIAERDLSAMIQNAIDTDAKVVSRAMDGDPEERAPVIERIADDCG